MRFASFRVTGLLFALSCLNPPLSHAQLTTEQKVHEMRHLIAYYQRYYAPAAWKKQLFGFDLSNEQPWVDRVAQADDLGVMELCIQYVASLNDSHTAYLVRSDWKAKLGFGVDSYRDGAVPNKILIDQIDREQLPSAQYPFQIGDELVSVDGVGVEAWIQRLSKWANASNERSKRSMAATAIVYRRQSAWVSVGAFPRAPLETGDTAYVVIRRAAGNLETYTIPWLKSGTPIVKYGPVHDGLYSQAEAQAEAGAYELHASIEVFGGKKPIIPLPGGFQQRMGNAPNDMFMTGVFPAGELQIGYLRIWTFNPLGPRDVALARLAAEIAYMNANTAALIVDLMHNGGGSPEYADNIYSYLSRTPYQGVSAVWRPSLESIKFVSAEIEATRSSGDPAVIAFKEAMLEQMRVAYERGDALVGPWPMVGTTITRQPAKDPQGNVVAYTKPVMLLTDDWTVSAGDHFSGLFRDNQRGIIFGTRTNGAGELLLGQGVGSYLEGNASAESTISMLNHVQNVPGYPPTRYWENVGIHPDIVEERATRENLMNGGATFSQHMVAWIIQHARPISTTPKR
jgi:Peptidase family S41